MTIEIKVPALPESVADATVAKWYKKPGEAIARDENLVDLETDKVMLEVPAPQAGVVDKIAVKEGEVVTADQLLAIIIEGAKAEVSAKEPAAEATVKTATDLSPAVRRMVAEKEIDVSQVSGSGKGGRITKQDVASHTSNTASNAPATAMSERSEKRVPMSRLRQKVAERLLEVQQNAAILTTFNEVNMAPVMGLRKQYKDQFEKTHGTRLGFMSFFTKACVEALKRFPEANASIDGGDIVYHNYYDIGIAIGSERGLVVPILRDADQMSMANMEAKIRDYSAKAKTGKIAIEDITGGTFSISNGGTYGSMLSTPILNPPQSAILGMHNIVERPMAVNGEVVIQPIMYLALSYDHRIIDGKTSILFLRTIKEVLEDPARMLLEV
ncbi:MAG: 2-oxoglutarate dehydrogenase complex dihydrolipoyllysine-residue succinyltransferase [Gammaproteobacteria bacterium]|nr:2-oxoglutarate dehydrogenase complex dihydrolipoyllysine-residue succinyltransferase [Gammaproteobacteria bacterium]